MTTHKTLENRIISVASLFHENLSIPNYQRPYKWTEKNISQLFQDLQQHSYQSKYRLGTIVFHKDEEKDSCNIVDGQQRTLTLALALQAIMETRLKLNTLERDDIKTTLNALQPHLQQFFNTQEFTNLITKKNLVNNYHVVKRIVSRHDFTEAHIHFLLNSCEVVVFKLSDISEAFQFFDSQNARGRDLDPHDLLKAYHLREFADHEQHLMASTVAYWESQRSKDLETLFANYLFRIRRWSQGYSARFFSKDHVDNFKGINIDAIDQYPYVQPLKITHHYVDDYNSSYHRRIDSQQHIFPFALDQMIINGRRFFEMATHYQKKVHQVVTAEHEHAQEFMGVLLSAQAKDILTTLNTYQRRSRTGDTYVRAMFDCALLFYIDKFGTAEISVAIEKLFVWAYRLRIIQQVVQLATMDNYVREHNVFRRIKDATTPHDILMLSLPMLDTSINKNNARDHAKADKDPLVILFKELGYYEFN